MNNGGLFSRRLAMMPASQPDCVGRPAEETSRDDGID
jgi:hypothetical protein